jgi:uncharacterized integral membrane protein (TIGR00697 family)
MTVLSFILIQAVLLLPTGEAGQQSAFEMVLGLSSLRIFSSLTAYLTSQCVDIYMYALIKRKSRFNFLWLRSNGSTWISQLVDTVVIDILFLYWGLGMSFTAVIPIMIFSYVYKVFFSVACTPVFYLCVYAFRGKLPSFLGKNEKIETQRGSSHG